MEHSRKRAAIEWAKNLAILFLTLSALYLISQSTLYDGFGTLSIGVKEPIIRSAQPDPVSTMRLSIQPIRLAVQNSEGRYGVQYDRAAVDQLFETKLGSVLRDALCSADNVLLSSQDQWNKVLSSKQAWIYYDFFTNLPISEIPTWLGSEEKNTKLSGTARRFLVVESEGNYVLYFSNDKDGTYYCAPLGEGGGSHFHSIVNEFAPNGAIFAFEAPQQYDSLEDYVMILPAVPTLWDYEVKNPIESLQEDQQEALLRSLAFNPRAVSVYQSAEGIVMREGVDTLRILSKGTLTFHSQETGQARYPVAQEDMGSIMESTQELLTLVMADRCGEGRPYLMDLTTQEDGSIVVLYGYKLNGAPIKVFSQGWAAQFVIQNNCIRDFTIHVRAYYSSNVRSVIMPERQAAAAVKAMGQEGKELLIGYIDGGDEPRITANWMVH